MHLFVCGVFTYMVCYVFSLYSVNRQSFVILVIRIIIIFKIINGNLFLFIRTTDGNQWGMIV